MPTIFTHPAVPAAIAVGLGRANISWRLACVAVVASVPPDLDVLSFRLGIPYSHPFGHRGATHSIAFALLLGLCASLLATQLRASVRAVFLFVTLATLSHPLLDMLTDGGRGVALFWPFSNARYFFPVQTIEVSTLNVRRFLGPAGVNVLLSEMRWMWLTCVGLVMCLLVWRRVIRSDDTKGPI